MTNIELIRAVAEKVMGWVWNPEWQMWYPHNEVPNCSPDQLIPENPSEDYKQISFDPIYNANHCMMVVERMRELGFAGGISWWQKSRKSSDDFVGVWFEDFENDQRGESYEETEYGRAVCLAALAAVKEGQ